MGLGERLITRALTALAAGTLFVRLNYIEALLHTLVADIYPWTGDKLLDLILCFWQKEQRTVLSLLSSSRGITALRIYLL